MLIFTIFLLSLSSLSDFTHAQDYNIYNVWLNSLREKGLILSIEEVRLIENNPDTLNERKEELSTRYAELLSEISILSDSLREIYNNTNDTDSIKSHILHSKVFIETCFRYAIAPLWINGEWDFNGYAKYPQRATIACGWFIQRIMEGLGFNIVSSRGLQLAQVASDEQVWSYAGYYSENLRNWDGLEEYVNENGEGLYITGLSSGWGHVLFLMNFDDYKMYFCHAGPSPQGCKVTYDNAELYVNEFMNPDIIHAVYLGEEIVLKWLNEEKIYPIKTKVYPGERISTNWRIYTAQNGLKDLDYYQGTVDYIYGPLTRRALLDFQNYHSLIPSQLPDNQTIELIQQLHRAQD